MALMTSCPACHTFFRVVPDQLRLHLGLVRCGSCEHVFDANQRLESITELPATQLAPDTPNDQSWINKPAVKVLAKKTNVSIVPSVPNVPNVPNAATPNKKKSTAALVDSGDDDSSDQRTLQESSSAQSAQSVAEQEALKRRRARKKAYLKKQALLAQEAASDTSADSPDSVAPEANDTDSEDSRSSKFSAVKAKLDLDGALGRGFKRFLAGTVLALLTMAGGTQLVLAARYSIADTVPMVKPLLVWLCDSAQCELEPALWLQPLSLDALSLSKRTDIAASSGLQAYRMIATVRNSSTLAVTRPDIELSINNLQGTLLARKVLPSQALANLKDRAAGVGSSDMPAASTLILPNGDWQIDVDVFLDAQTLGYTGRLVHSPQQ